MAIKHIDLGYADYKEVWDLQKETHLKKQKENSEDIVYTVDTIMFTHLVRQQRRSYIDKR